MSEIGNVYIRGAQPLVTISHICCVFNVADVGAKLNSNFPFLGKLVRAGRFDIAPMTGKDAKSIFGQQKARSKSDEKGKGPV